MGAWSDTSIKLYDHVAAAKPRGWPLGVRIGCVPPHQAPHQTEARSVALLQRRACHDGKVARAADLTCGGGRGHGEQLVPIAAQSAITEIVIAALRRSSAGALFAGRLIHA